MVQPAAYFEAFTLICWSLNHCPQKQHMHISVPINAGNYMWDERSGRTEIVLKCERSVMLLVVARQAALSLSESSSASRECYGRETQRQWSLEGQSPRVIFA